MRRFLSAVLASFVLALLVACSGASDGNKPDNSAGTNGATGTPDPTAGVVGVWESAARDKITLTIKAGGAFTMSEHGGEMTGTWTASADGDAVAGELAFAEDAESKPKTTFALTDANTLTLTMTMGEQSHSMPLTRKP